MSAAQALSQKVGVTDACEALGLSRASFYRYQEEKVAAREQQKHPSPPRSLKDEERKLVVDVLHSERFYDLAPAQVYATLLDEGHYLCSIRTMYRILEQEGENKERRRQRKHTAYQKPELLATAPNQVWSWDITKLKGPISWTYYHLYVIMDIFSRYVVGWTVSCRESSHLAEQLIAESCYKQGILPGQLTLHADRGPSMRSKTVAQMLADLEVTKSHSRPYVSNDNPFSESLFKTTKYHPEFPDRFGCPEDAREFCHAFFLWYNEVHYHSGIGLLPPIKVHYGLATETIEKRQETLAHAYERNPERFSKGRPLALHPPKEVWINKPTIKQEDADKTEVIVTPSLEDHKNSKGEGLK